MGGSSSVAMATSSFIKSVSDTDLCLRGGSAGEALPGGLGGRRGAGVRGGMMGGLSLGVGSGLGGRCGGGKLGLGGGTGTLTDAVGTSEDECARLTGVFLGGGGDSLFVSNLIIRAETLGCGGLLRGEVGAASLEVPLTRQG